MSFRKLVWTILIVMVIGTILPQTGSAYDVIGDPDNPSLTLHKFEQEPGAETTGGTGLPDQTVDDGEPLEGVAYDVVQTHTYDPDTHTWEEISNGETYSGVTDENGQLVVEGIELGRYAIDEVEGPEHVVLNPDTYYADIPMTNETGDTLNYDVHMYPKNETIRGAVELTKVDEEGGELTGAVFELYDGDGEQIGDTFVTDSDGLIQVDGLPFGEYQFVEVEAPDGHALNESPVEFTITDPGTIDGAGDTTGAVVGTDMTNYSEPVPEKNIVDPDTGDLIPELEINRDEVFSYQIDSSLPGDIANYDTFTLTDTLDDRLVLEEDSVTVLVDDEPFNGAAISTDSQAITVDVTDFEALDGAGTITVQFEASIHPDAELEPEETGIPNDMELEFDNGSGGSGNPTPPPVHVVPTEGGMTVIKVDAADHSLTLEGAEFDLLDENGNAVEVPEDSVIRVNGEAVSSLEGLTTDSDGQFTVTGLDLGNYLLEETAAPTYTDENGDTHSYRLLTEPIEVTVTEDEADDNEVIVENTSQGWELPETGGVGTIWYTLVGLVLMGAAVTLLARRKMMHAKG